MNEDAEKTVNEEGQTEYKFVTYFTHNGLEYQIPFYALDFEDAANRVKSIRQTLSVEGISQVYEEFDDNWFYIKWMRVTSWIKEHVFHR